MGEGYSFQAYPEKHLGDHPMAKELKYNPPKDQIKRFIEQTKGDPETMAIAYLRARRRAADYKLGFEMLDKIGDATERARQGDAAAVISGLDDVSAMLRKYNSTNNQTSE